MIEGKKDKGTKEEGRRKKNVCNEYMKPCHWELVTLRQGLWV